MHISEKAKTKAVAEFDGFKPLSFEEAMKEFAEVDGDKETDHCDADRIVLAYLKGLGGTSQAIALEWMKLEQEHEGFWYA